MKRILIRTVIIIGALIVLAVLFFGYLYFDASRISTGDPIPAADLAAGENPDIHPALIVVDIQEAITGDASTSPGYVEQADNLIAATNHVISLADSNRVPVVYITQETTNWLLNLATNNMMAKGQPGTKVDARVNIVSPHFFSKAKMDAFSNPELDAFLRGKQINRLYLVGLDAGFCVNRTAFAALNRKYQVNLIDDALITEKPADKQKNLEAFREAGMRVIAIDQYAAEIAALNVTAVSASE